MRRNSWHSIPPVLAILPILLFWGCQRTKPSRSEEPIRIGAILPLTGESARYGQYIREGIDLAVAEINTDHGINGRPLTIIYEDDAAQPRLAASAMTKLAEIDHVPVVIGSWASGCVLAEAPIAEKMKVVVMAIAISPKITAAGDYIFRIQPSATSYINALVPYLVHKVGVRKLAVLYVNNDFGLSQAADIREQFEAQGGTIVFAKGFPSGTADFRTEIAELRKANPDAVFVPAYTEIASFLKQAREMGLSTRFVASVPFENPDILKLAGSAAEGVIYPYHYCSGPANDLDKGFRIEFAKRYGKEPDGFAALAYDAVRIIGSSLKAVGTDPDRIKAALYATHDFPGVTGKTSFDSNGDVIKPIIIKTVVDGQFVDLPSGGGTSAQALGNQQAD